MATFNQALKDHIKASEGGYVNNPNDRGGETKYGISKRSYPKLDIKNLTWAQALEIYERDFWKKMNLGQLKDQELANNVMDFGINAGIHQAGVSLQRVLGFTGTNVDGKIGPVTIAAANAMPTAAAKYSQERIRFYQSLAQTNPSQAGFLNGWINRTLKLLPTKQEVADLGLGAFVIVGSIVALYLINRKEPKS